MNKKEIINFIKEAFRTIFNEAKETEHSDGRILTRIKNKNIASEKENIILNNNLNLVKEKRFPEDKSIAALLVQFDVNKSSPYAVEEDGRFYYKIENEDGKGFSIGDQLWAVIRGNEITTIMLRRDNQSFEKIRVDYILKTTKKIEDFKYIAPKKK